jgi:hypothetical protein
VSSAHAHGSTNESSQPSVGRYRRSTETSPSPAAQSSPCFSENVTLQSLARRPQRTTGPRTEVPLTNTGRTQEPTATPLSVAIPTASPIKIKEKKTRRRKKPTLTLGTPEVVDTPRVELDYRFGTGPMPDAVPEEVIPLGRSNRPVPFGTAVPLIDISENISSSDEGGRNNPIIAADGSVTSSDSSLENRSEELATATMQDFQEEEASALDHTTGLNAAQLPENTQTDIHDGSEEHDENSSWIQQENPTTTSTM